MNRKITVEIESTSEEGLLNTLLVAELLSKLSLEQQCQIISAIEEEFNIRFTPDILMDLEDVSDILAATEERAGK